MWFFKCSNASHFSLVTHWKTSSMQGPDKPTITRPKFMAGFYTSLVHPHYIKVKGLIVVLSPFTNTRSKSYLSHTAAGSGITFLVCSTWQAEKTQKCNCTNPPWELFPSQELARIAQKKKTKWNCKLNCWLVAMLVRTWAARCRMNYFRIIPQSRIWFHFSVCG